MGCSSCGKRRQLIHRTRASTTRGKTARKLPIKKPSPVVDEKPVEQPTEPSTTVDEVA